MRRTRMVLLVGLLLLPALLAADKPATPAEQLETLKKEVETTRAEFYQAYAKAKTDKERQDLRDKNDKQIKASARRALELAQKHPKDPAAVDALMWIIAGGLGWNGAGDEIQAAFDLLRTDYVTSDKLERVCDGAHIYDSVSTKPEQFLRAVMKNNPHRAIQGHASYSLVQVLRRQASRANLLLRDPAYAKAMEKAMQEDMYRDIIKRLKASNPDKLQHEAEELLERIIAKYSDVKTYRGTLGEQAKATLFEMKYLVIGKTAPEIEGEDLDGKRFKLSDYRGKVVVLDFWGNW